MNPQNNNQNIGPMMPVPTKSKYSAFYLIMLILATISAVFTFFGFFGSVYSSVVSFNEGRYFIGIISIIEIVIGIASLATLALLYMKKKAGFVMKMVLILLSIFLGIAASFATSSTFVSDFNAGFEQSYSNGDEKTVEEDQIANSIKKFVNDYSGSILITATIIGVIYKMMIALLWFFAWKSQLKHDAEFFGPSN